MKPEVTTPQTRGSELIGSFNVGGRRDVAAIKQLMTDVVDIVQEARTNTLSDTAARRVADHAEMEILSAQMWAVKAVTFSDDVIPETTWLQRVEQELAELDQRRSVLDERLQQPQGDIDEDQWSLMFTQAEAMAAYALILQERIAKANKNG